MTDSLIGRPFQRGFQRVPIPKVYNITFARVVLYRTEYGVDMCNIRTEDWGAASEVLKIIRLSRMSDPIYGQSLIRLAAMQLCRIFAPNIGTKKHQTGNIEFVTSIRQQLE